MDVEIKGSIIFTAEDFSIALTPKGVAYNKLPHELKESGFDFQKFTELNDAVVHVMLKYIEQLIKGHTLSGIAYNGVEDEEDENNGDSQSEGHQN